MFWEKASGRVETWVCHIRGKDKRRWRRGDKRKEGQTQQLCHVGSQGTWASFCNTEAVMEEPRGRRTASCWLGRMLGSEWRRYLSKDKTEKKNPDNLQTQFNSNWNASHLLTDRLQESKGNARDPEQKKQPGKTRNWGCTFSDFNTYYRATVIKTVWFWHKERQQSVGQNWEIKNKPTCLWPIDFWKGCQNNWARGKKESFLFKKRI